MKTIITSGATKFKVFLDDEDYEWAKKFKWNISNGYAKRYENRKGILMAREIMNFPAGMDVDHIDRNRLNNRRSNLRVATKTQNAKNKTSLEGSTSKYLGVHLNVAKCTRVTKKYGMKQYISYSWRARICTNKKYVHLGYFKTESLAALAYNEAAKKYHGEFASLNVII